jgi:hypothetical protein
MFHLLVSSAGWADGGSDTIPTSRIYIKPGEKPDSLMLTDGKLDSAKVSRIPALFMTEIGGRDPQIARVAHITGVVSGARETTLRYVIDANIPAIPSADLGDFAGQIGVDKFSLSHTHWRVCDADLFRILFQVQLENSALAKFPGPTVFSTDAINDQDDDLVSVMMPFGKEFDPVLTALQVAAKGVGLRCVRADDIWIHHHVIQDIVDLIAKARVVICDCTGKNPNVFYEIGIAHSLGKDVILITQTKGDIPFDLQSHRYKQYLSNKEGLADLSEAIQARLKTLIS